MAIKRYYATKDNTITNAFKSNLSTRGVSGNMGQSDILEVFSIYGQVSSSTGLSSELSRVIIQFDTDAINTDRTTNITMCVVVDASLLFEISINQPIAAYVTIQPNVCIKNLLNNVKSIFIMV